MDNPMHVVSHSRYLVGGYRVGAHEITNADVLEFIDNGRLVQCRVEHDGMRYMVLTNDERVLPLAELVWARYVGRA